MEQPQASRLRATAPLFHPEVDVDIFADEFVFDNDFYTQVGDDDTLSEVSEPVRRVNPAAIRAINVIPPTPMQFRDHTYSTNVSFVSPTVRIGLQEVLHHVCVGKVYNVSYFHHKNTFEVQFFTHEVAITFLTQIFRREFKIRGHVV